ELVQKRAKLAFDEGIDGVIASGHEAEVIRQSTGSEFLIVTPGIRPSGSAANDQARAMTPKRAILAGADYLVVGRPILGAPDRKKAALDILSEIRAAKSA